MKIFRSKRSKANKDGKIKKYFLYAVGEIILVVIGILIAFQIDNWNEANKLQGEESELLLNLKFDLEKSSIELKKTIKYHEEGLLKFKNLDKHIEEDLAYYPELDSAIYSITSWASPYLYYSAYKTLKARGLDIIQDDNIKKKIVLIYEHDFPYLTNDYDRTEWEFQLSVVRPFASKNFRIDYNKWRCAEPNDFEKLKEDPEFHNILHTVIMNRIWGIEEMSELDSNLSEAIIIIEDELQNSE